MQSQQGNKYIMVMVEIDSNAILAKPMKSNKDAEMIQVYDNEKHKIQKGLEPFISQQIWMISKRHWRQNEEPHQHHRVHLPTQGPERAKARRYVRAIRVHSMTQKG
jgi:hypothetical protein